MGGGCTGGCKPPEPCRSHGPGRADEDVASRETEYAGAAATEAMKPFAIAPRRCAPVATSFLPYIDLNLHAQHFRCMKVHLGPSWAKPGGPAGIFDHHLLSPPQRIRRLLTNGVVQPRARDVTRQLGSRQSARTCSFMGSGEKAGAAFGGIARRGPVSHTRSAQGGPRAIAN